MKSEWGLEIAKNDGKDVDLGKVQLRASLGGSSTPADGAKDNDKGDESDGRRR